MEKYIYQINFTADNVTLQLNSSFLNPSYQLFAPGLFYSNPGFNNMTQIGMIDLMEDYRIIAGFRLPRSRPHHHIVKIFVLEQPGYIFGLMLTVRIHEYNPFTMCSPDP